MFAHYIRFLYSLDSEWTRTHVLPLLDWSADGLAAEQAWHCYLNNSSLDPAAIVDAGAYYEQTFRHLDQLRICREKFIEHLSLIAVDASIGPRLVGWHTTFLCAATLGDRCKWAQHLGTHLGSMKAAPAKHLWQSWLHSYWDKRNRGIPVLLESSEVSAMLSWLPALKPIFAQAVDCACAGPPPDHAPYYDLSRMELTAEHAPALAKLLLFLLSHEKTPFWHHQEVLSLMDSLAKHHTPQKTMRKLLNRLLELNCRPEDLSGFAK
jgi:hypothetical protein